MKEFIEIPFGAKDSELGGWEYTIPEGFVASIENGKIVVKKEESEDERIRKTLLGYFKNQDAQYTFYGLTNNEVIAWLEKVIIPNYNDIDSSFIEDIKEVIADAPLFMQSDKEKMIAWLEKQGDIDRRIQEEIEKQTKQQWKTEKQGGQNLAWSEEDERLCNTSIRACQYMVEHFENSTWDYEDAIDWLKSLKNKVQPKQGEHNTISPNTDSLIDSALNDYCCKVYNALHKENCGILSFARLQHLAMDIYRWCKENLQVEQKNNNKGE